MRKEIRKRLLEEKKKRENQLIESKLIESRILFIVESKEKFNSLSEKNKRKVFLQLMEEMNSLDDDGLINEQFADVMTKIFGSTFSGIAQSFIEPMVHSMLGAVGFGGFFQAFVTSFIVSSPDRIIKAFKNCDELTKLISEALSEGLFMMFQRNQGLSGRGYNILRNSLGDAVKKTDFIMNLQENLSSHICEIFDKHTANAQNVFDTLKQKGKDTFGSITGQ